MNRFEGKVAIVTGGGNGIGKSYAQGLCKEGCKVMIAEFNEEYGRQAEEELKKLGYEATFTKCDVSNEEDVKNMVKQTIEKYKTIDILINNAQFHPTQYDQPIDKTTIDIFKTCWNTGALGTILCTRYVSPYMVEKKYGRIINTASVTGVLGYVNFSAFGSQKEAIRGLTRSWAHELGQYGITCNVICPSAFTEGTKRWAEMFPEDYNAACQNTPLKRLGDLEKDCTPPVLFLASDDAQYVTGQTIGVDGGMTMLP